MIRRGCYRRTKRPAWHARVLALFAAALTVAAMSSVGVSFADDPAPDPTPAECETSNIAAPTNIGIAADPAVAGTLTVTFTGSVTDFTADDPCNGGSITGYEYAINGGTDWSAPSTSGPFTLSGLTGGTSYSVSLRAVASIPNSSGPGEPSTVYGTPSWASTGTPLAEGTPPTFGLVTRTNGGFTVQISNYNNEVTYTTGVDSSGTASQAERNVTVTSLADNTTATLTVTATRSGYTTKSAPQQGTSLATGTAPSLSITGRTAAGYTAKIGNYDNATTYILAVSQGGASSTGDTVTVTTVESDSATNLTVTAQKSGFTDTSASISSQALFTGTAPDLNQTETRSNVGFTTQITNFDVFKPASPAAYGPDTATHTNQYYADTTVTASVDGGAQVKCGTSGASATNGPVACLGSGAIIVTNVSNGAAVTVTVSVASENHTATSSSITRQALFTGTDPTFTEPLRTGTGFTADITNWNLYQAGTHVTGTGTHNGNYYGSTTVVTASVTATAGGNPVVACGGTPAATTTCATKNLTVTGLTDGQAATVTVTITDDNHTSSNASTTGQSLFTGILPMFTAPLRTDTGFTASIANFATFQGAGHGSGSSHTNAYTKAETTVTATVSGNSGSKPTVRCGTSPASEVNGSSICAGNGGIAIEGLKNGETATVTVDVTDELRNHTNSTNSFTTGQSLYDGVTPTFGGITRTSTGFTVPITNYAIYRETGHDGGAAHNDSRYDVTETHVVPTVTAVSPDGVVLADVHATLDAAKGTVTVTGLSNGQKATIAVTVDDVPTGSTFGHNHTTVATNIEGQALWTGTTPSFGPTTRTIDGFTTSISNFDPDATYTVTSGARLGRSGSSLTISGLKPGESAAVTVTADKAGHTSKSASTTGTALHTGQAPTASAPIQTVHGFIVSIANFDPKATYTATVSGSATARASVSGASVTVTGVKPGEAVTVTITAMKDGFTTTTQNVAFTMPQASGTDKDPTGGATVPDIAEHAPGTASAQVNGVLVPVTMNTGANGLTVRAGDLGMTAIALVDGQPVPLERGGILSATQQGYLDVNVSGFGAGTSIQVWIFSTPTLLGTFAASPGGDGLVRVPIPAAIPVGNHTLVVHGVTADGTPTSIGAGIHVIAPRLSATAAGIAASPTAGNGRDAAALSYTGTNPIGSLHLAAILLLLGAGLIALTNFGRRTGAHLGGSPIRIAMASADSVTSISHSTTNRSEEVAISTPIGTASAGRSAVAMQHAAQPHPAIPSQARPSKCETLIAASAPEVVVNSPQNATEQPACASRTLLPPLPQWLSATEDCGRRSVSDAEWRNLTAWLEASRATR